MPVFFPSSTPWGFTAELVNLSDGVCCSIISASSVCSNWSICDECHRIVTQLEKRFTDKSQEKYKT